MDFKLRPVVDSDLPFLEALYATGRDDELAGMAWSNEQKAAFLKMQFSSQHQYYQVVCMRDSALSKLPQMAFI